MADYGALLERVKAATGPDRELDAEIAVAFSGDPGAWVVNPSPHSIFSPAPGWYRTSDDTSHSAPEVTASLDAALALVDRLLPGWTKRADLYPGGAVFSVERPFKPDVWAAVPAYQGEAPTPALALLEALLSALVSAPERV